MSYQMNNQYDTYTSSTISNQLNKSNHVFIPIGATEAHSSHLPLSTDNDILTRYVYEIAKKTKGLVLPIIPYGQTWSLQYAPGSIHIEEDVLVDFLFSILKSLEYQKIKTAIFVTSHFGNFNALKRAARKAYDALKIKVIYISYPGLSEIKSIFENLSLDGTYLHADEIETSLMLHIRPDLVDMTKVEVGQIQLDKKSTYTPKRWTEFMDTYILGDASKASSKKGKQALEILVNSAVDLIIKEVNDD